MEPAQYKNAAMKCLKGVKILLCSCVFLLKFLFSLTDWLLLIPYNSKLFQVQYVLLFPPWALSNVTFAC